MTKQGEIFDRLVNVTIPHEGTDALRLGKDRFSQSQRIAKIGSWEHDIAKNEDWWSDEVFAIIEEDPSTYKASFENFLAKIHPDDRHRMIDSKHGTTVTGRQNDNTEARIVLQDGRQKFVHLLIEGLSDEKGQPETILGTLHDITDRVGLEREIVTVSERARERVGRDLHDNLGQLLTGISMSMRRLSDELASEHSRHERAASHITEMITKAVEEAGNLSRCLLPVTDMRFGFNRALQALARDVDRDSLANCRAQCSDDDEVRDVDAATHLYRIAEEAVTNALKHSNAQSIEIRFGRDGNGLLLEVIDDGVGIPIERDRTEGLGLKSMRYRTRMLHGQLTVTVGPQGGTQVFCSCPVPENSRS